ncbi:VOC family protein [Streptomyces salyersiae]|uniref:VOC family virulence protein n=1 Tax=Streptomyces salyersiae TaxID=3075530 RepID=A0ABU2RH89_9ACTN|nr:VOC family virulence protein [Streptomyces sp. DSM 41770]MDT0428213.1 VOC family virulence protein [Streptomyces sp. DSM 41770]
MRPRVKDFDHLVLNVYDVERALEFHCGPLGLEPVRVDQWRAGEVPFPSDWQEVVASGVFTVLEGPADRFGARGEARSVYVQDPDGNTVELRCHPQDEEGAPAAQPAG